MTLRPWHQIRLLLERLTHAENAVKRLMQHNQILSTDALVIRNELSKAHAALRRKNVTLKRLRTKPKEARP